MTDNRLVRGGGRAWRRVQLLPGAVTGTLSSALVVTLPEAEPVVASLRDRHDPGARDGIPAHITVLAPFLASRRLDEAVMSRLRTLCASVEEVPVSLMSVGKFPAVTYLAPADPQPFERLTAMLYDAWPDCPPYGGAFRSVVPHLTVADGPHDHERVRRDLLAVLPIDAIARGVTLLCERPDGTWSSRSVFPFAQR